MHLLVPGLFGPMPGMDPWPQEAAEPELGRWLARSRVGTCPGYDAASTLCSLFGLPLTAERDLPLAAFSRLGDGAAPDRRFWLQADPVCLRPDQSRLLLFDTQDFDFSMAEAERLADLLRAHFQDAGWCLETPVPHRWYLSPGQPPRLLTQGLEQVFGRNMDPFLPQGEDALAWHAILNEIQMLFFQADVNQAREAAGRMPVGGVWFSGGGSLPARMPVPGFSWVAADQPLALGLARHAGIAQLDVPDDPNDLPLGQGGGLVLYHRLQRPVWRADPYDWHEELQRFDDWLAGIIGAMGDRRLSRLLIYPGNGRRFQLDRAALRRFWRRRRPYDRWLDQV